MKVPQYDGAFFYARLFSPEEMLPLVGSVGSVG